ncbi:hypothetical protein AB0E59_29865 [Lentzea sp. NPDC034063]|uniref:hypothetical protein n=1 Tax=unclassified Lentzea TaxID=2643253 RepID=UPI0033D81ECF
MGTFGTGPFDSGGALDLLDDLAARPADSRADVLAALLGRPIADPACVGRELFADRSRRSGRPDLPGVASASRGGTTSPGRPPRFCPSRTWPGWCRPR